MVDIKNITYNFKKYKSFFTVKNDLFQIYIHNYEIKIIKWVASITN